MSFLGMLKDTCTLQARMKCQKFTYTGSTGTPVVGMTLTGVTSLKTAIITRLFTGYVVVKQLSGTFTNGEIIASGVLFSATLGTATDYVNEEQEPEYYWTNNQTSIPCRFYYGGGSNVALTERGEFAVKPLQVVLPSSVTIADYSYRITTTASSYAGTYDMAFLTKDAMRYTHHHEAVLTKVITP